MERGTVSGPLYVCEHDGKRLFRTVIDSERYRACTDTLRRLYGPEYPRDLITFRLQLLPHGVSENPGLQAPVCLSMTPGAGGEPCFALF